MMTKSHLKGIEATKEMWIDSESGYMTFKVTTDNLGHFAKITLRDGNFIQTKHFEDMSNLMAYVVSWAVDYFQSIYLEKAKLNEEEVGNFINKWSWEHSEEGLLRLTPREGFMLAQAICAKFKPANADKLAEALKAMIKTHGMHGHCEQNGCKDCNSARDVALELCRRNILHFFRFFLWTFDPRQKNKELPFIPYDYQEKYINDLITAIDKGKSLLTQKSRDIGVTAYKQAKQALAGYKEEEK